MRNKLTKEEKKQIRDERHNGLVKKAPTIFAVMMLFFSISSFFTIYTYVSRLFDWQLILISIMMQAYNYMFGFLITDLIHIKNNWVRFIIVIVVATFMDCTFDIEFTNNCSNAQVIVYVISCVVFFACLFNLRYFNWINEHLISKFRYHIRCKIQIIYIIFSIITFLLMIAALVYIGIVYCVNHEYVTITLKWI